MVPIQAIVDRPPLGEDGEPDGEQGLTDPTHAEIVTGLEEGQRVVAALYGGYGELNQTDLCPDPRVKHCAGPKLERILREGNAYLAREFPKMSKVHKAWISGEYRVQVSSPVSPGAAAGGSSEVEKSEFI